MDSILIIVALLAAVLLVAAVVYVLLKRKRSYCESDQVKERKVKVRDRNMAHYPYCARLTIDGMTCQRCRLRVENALNAKGNIWADVDLKDGSAIVRMKEKLPDATLERIVSREGFTVVGIERIL